MATLVQLPTELLAHILHLENEGAGSAEQQGNRFAFSLVARPLFLASADATTFYIAGEAQAKALLAKLQREKKWAAQEERKAKSGRTTRSTLSITRVSTIRRLALQLNKKTTKEKTVASLLRAAPLITALELFAETQQILQQCVASLELAFAGLTELPEFKLVANGIFSSISQNSFTRLLIPLIALESLDMANVRFTDTAINIDLLDKVICRNLLQIRTVVNYYVDKPVFIRLASTSTRLKTLHLDRTSLIGITSSLRSHVPLVASIVHLTWTPSRVPVSEDDRDSVLTFVGAMTSLETLLMPMWTIGDYSTFLWGSIRPGTGKTVFDREPVDTSLLATLAALTHLRAVELIVQIGTLDDDPIASYVRAGPALRAVSIEVRNARSWSSEQRERVQAAGEEAGVAFSYREAST